MPPRRGRAAALGSVLPRHRRDLGSRHLHVVRLAAVLLDQRRHDGEWAPGLEPALATHDQLGVGFSLDHDGERLTPGSMEI